MGARVTAINVNVAPDRISLLADGAQYAASGMVVGHTAKIWPLPYLNTIVAVSGATLSGPIVANTFGCASSAADLKSRAAEYLADALAIVRVSSRFPDRGTRVVVAGYDNGQPDCWLLSSVDDDEFHLPAWTVTPIGGLLVTPCVNGRMRDQILAILGTREPSQLNHEIDGLRVLEVQRKHAFALPDGKPVHALGRHAQIATIRPDGEITTKILRRW